MRLALAAAFLVMTVALLPLGQAWAASIHEAESAYFQFDLLPRPADG